MMRVRRMVLVLPILLILVSLAGAQSTAFSYQGKLLVSGVPANGNYDFQFRIYDLPTGGTQIGATPLRTNIPVVDGIYTVSVDFGSAPWTSGFRYMEINVRPAGSGSFTTLSPRQEVQAVPYAIRSANSTSADSVAVGGVPAGSGNYIQNGTTQQASSNFNISGNGTANVFDAGTQFNIGGNRVLSNAGTNNLFAGVNAGQANTTGGNNAFFGAGAGQNNSAGSNAFFGAEAGLNNSTGDANAFFGRWAGLSNTTGHSNAFFGALAGRSNTTGNFNVFFGEGAGLNTAESGYNTFVGTEAGLFNTTGAQNSFFGLSAGANNTTGSNNTLIGYGANVLNADLTSATAIGHRAAVGTNNSLVLGSINGVNGATADTNVGIGTTTPQYRLHVKGENIRVEGNSASTLPRFSLNFTGGAADAKKWQNYAAAGALRFSALNDAENGETIWLNVIRQGLSVPRVEFNNSDVYVANKLFVGLPSSPDTLAVGGTISFATLGAAGSTQLCKNATNQIASCSSSLRYKTNIGQFSSGLAFVNELRPITFDWKDGGMKDIGFGAEDIAKIDPRFVTYNSSGEVEGVKYDRLSVAFVNAFKEQQTQIETLQTTNTQQQKLMESQQRQIEDLTQALCSLKPELSICTPK